MGLRRTAGFFALALAAAMGVIGSGGCSGSDTIDLSQLEGDSGGAAASGGAAGTGASSGAGATGGSGGAAGTGGQPDGSAVAGSAGVAGGGNAGGAGGIGGQAGSSGSGGLGGSGGAGGRGGASGGTGGSGGAGGGTGGVAGAGGSGGTGGGTGGVAGAGGSGGVDAAAGGAGGSGGMDAAVGDASGTGGTDAGTGDAGGTGGTDAGAGDAGGTGGMDAAAGDAGGSGGADSGADGGEDVSVGPDAEGPDAGTDASSDAALDVAALLPVGAPCTDAAQCLGNTCLTAANGFPDGYCTRSACDTGPWDSVCLPYGGDGYCIDVGGAARCFDGCNPNAPDCRTGYYCLDIGSGIGICYPGPACGNSIIESGEECDPPSPGSCTSTCQGVGIAPIGAVCTSALDCLGNACLTNDSGWPGGYCTYAGCDLGNPLTSCAAYGGDGVCQDLGTPVCLDRCNGATDCRSGYYCAYADAGIHVCYLDGVCGDGTVGHGEDCDPPGGSCSSTCQGPGTAPIGAACTSPMDCLSNGCLTPGNGYPNGYCTQLDCDLTAPNTSCAAYGGDGVCVDMTGNGYGACFDRCDPDAPDCRTGYGCGTVAAVDICLPL